MLSNPAVLGEVGLVLGTFCHLFIVVGCAFACYLLLAARQMAKMEVAAKQRRDAERREEYRLWKIDMEHRAAAQQRAAAIEGQISSRQAAADGRIALPNLDQSGHGTIDQSGRRRVQKCSSLQVTTTESTGEGEWTVAPVPVPLTGIGASGTSSVPPKQGWGRCEEACQTATDRECSVLQCDPEIHSFPAQSLSLLTPKNMMGSRTPIQTMDCGNVQLMKQSRMSPKRSNIWMEKAEQSNKTPSSSSSAQQQVSDEYQRFTDRIHNDYMPPRPPPPLPPPPPEKTAQSRLVTYGDVAKYLAGKRASVFIIFTIVMVHLMFASGMVHLAVENLCYVIGWE